MSDQAPPRRRVAAVAVDLLVLAAGLAGTFVFGLSVLTSELALVFVAIWVVLVAPLYFALYHGRGDTARSRSIQVDWCEVVAMFGR